MARASVRRDLSHVRGAVDTTCLFLLYSNAVHIPLLIGLPLYLYSYRGSRLIGCRTRHIHAPNKAELSMRVRGWACRVEELSKSMSMSGRRVEDIGLKGGGYAWRTQS